MNKSIKYSSAAVFLIAIAAASLGSTLGQTFEASSPIQESTYENSEASYNVEVKLKRAGSDEWKTVATEKNVLMEGEEAIEQAISGQETGNSWDTIALGNGTAPTDSDGSLNNEIDNCGLSQSSGTYSDDGDGDWNISNTFDVTCDDVPVNTTALLSTGASSNIDYYAGTDLGRTITAYSGDSIDITWENTADDQ